MYLTQPNTKIRNRKWSGLGAARVGLQPVHLRGLGCGTCSSSPTPLPPRQQSAGRMGRMGNLADGSYLAAGTRLIYNATWASSSTVFTNGPKAVAAAIASVLSSQWGIEIDSEADQSGFFTNALGFTLQVHTTRDYGQADDIRSIINGAIINTAGRNVTSSNIAVIATPNASTPGTADSAQQALQQTLDQAAANYGQSSSSGNTASDWFSNNWEWFALGGAGLVGLIVLREVL